MANWLDLISLVIMLAVTVGVVYAISVGTKQVSEAFNNTKETLKNKGLNISDKGVSVKTTSRFNREDYVDATQRAFIKTMGAASFGSSEIDDKQPVPISRQNSATGSIRSVSSSTNTGGEEGPAKKKRGFMIRKSSH